MRKWAFAAVALLAVALLSACGGKKYEAVPINEETDVCEICNMQVKDDAYATQLTTKDGKTYKFDDIGCMNEWKTKNGVDKIGMDYVRDYNDKEWVEFSKATYVYDESFRTPMAYGILSFKNEKDAEAFAAEQGVGRVMSASELAGHSWAQNKKGMDMGGGEHGHEAEEGGSGGGHGDADSQPSTQSHKGG